jgi:transcription antitermination factor NusG
VSHFLFRFNQAYEDRVQRNADRHGIEVISPKVMTWRRTGKRGTKPRPVAQPAFHSYLILGFEPDQLHSALTKLHRSVRPMLVPFDGHEWTLARVPDAEVERIKDCRLFTSRNAPPPVVNDPKFKKEEVLRILGGAATGLEGRVISADPKAREAELDMAGWPVKLVVSYDLLERAEAA